MHKKYIKRHISMSFNRDLAGLLEMIKAIGKSTDEQFSLILEEITTDQNIDQKIDSSLAKREQKTREFETKINVQCHQIMALRSPVASDLRLVLATLHATSEIRRVSRELSRFAEINEDKSFLDKALLDDIVAYARRVQKYFNSAYLALSKVSDKKALKVISKQTKGKKTYNKIINQLNELSNELSAKSGVQPLINVFFCVEALHNICKSCASIAKNALSIDDGIDVLFADSKDITERHQC